MNHVVQMPKIQFFDFDVVFMIHTVYVAFGLTFAIISPGDEEQKADGHDLGLLRVGNIKHKIDVRIRERVNRSKSKSDGFARTHDQRHQRKEEKAIRDDHRGPGTRSKFVRWPKF